MKDQLEFELGDCYQSNLINEGNKVQREVEDFKKRIEQALQRDEIDSLATILAKVPMRELAEYGPKIISILSYYNKP